MSEPSEIRVNLLFRGRQLAEFLAIKEYLGIHNNTDVVRYLVRRHARALRRRKRAARPTGGRQAGERRISGAPAPRSADPRSAVQRAGVKEGVREGASTAPRQEGTAPPSLLCLDCPLPECDEGDPRCLYQQATGERAQKRARTRAYMRHVREK